MSPNLPKPEFSRPFTIERLSAGVLTEVLRASPAECVALAKRLGLVELRHLSAMATLERRPGGLIHVTCRFTADVVQTCVVTLAAFPSHVEDGFTLDFGDVPPGFGDVIEMDPDYDPPEPIEGGIIDLGELVSQYLALALDPYPRAPGATLDTAWTGVDVAHMSPFAILKNLKTPN